LHTYFLDNGARGAAQLFHFLVLHPESFSNLIEQGPTQCRPLPRQESKLLFQIARSYRETFHFWYFIEPSFQLGSKKSLLKGAGAHVGLHQRSLISSRAILCL